MFLVVMVIGLVGLATMAIPAFARHGTAPSPHGHGTGGGHLHAPAARAGALVAPRAPAAPAAATQSSQNQSGIGRWIPSPRAIFTVFALYGAFGNLLIEAFHFSLVLAALVAIVPTLLFERLAVRPLWNLVFRFQGRPSAPLEQLILADAVAVVPFRNGRGIVSANREGRIVQLAARLQGDQAALPVKVGDRLRIEDVDARNERVTVSVQDHE
jgi:hypothetical protein